MRILGLALVVALFVLNEAHAATPAQLQVDLKPAAISSPPAPSLADQLKEHEQSINDLYAQLIAVPRAERAQIFLSHAPEILEKLSEIYSTLQDAPMEQSMEKASVERLLNALGERDKNRYLMSPEEYALWLSQQAQ